MDMRESLLSTTAGSSVMVKNRRSLIVVVTRNVISTPSSSLTLLISCCWHIINIYRRSISITIHPLLLDCVRCVVWKGLTNRNLCKATVKSGPLWSLLTTRLEMSTHLSFVFTKSLPLARMYSGYKKFTPPCRNGKFLWWKKMRPK